jgi:ParB/RepB/Spo0J family partition protein
MKKPGLATKKRGLAPRALLEDATRRSALASLERPIETPAAAFVRAALEDSGPAAEAAPPPIAKAPAPIAKAAPAALMSEDAPVSERTLRAIPIHEIDLEKRRFQYRVTRSLARLQESLLVQGQQVPVILRGKTAPYEIVSGFGRCDALMALFQQGKTGEPRVWVDLRPELTDREAHEISVLENEEREGLTELDRISKARRLKDEGYTISDIATVLKKGERMVQYYLSLAEAPEKISIALAKGVLRPTHALVLTKFAREALSELEPGEIEGRLEDLIERCGRGASVPELRAAIANAQAPSAPKLLVPRGKGFELRSFHYSPTQDEKAKRALLAVLDEARSRIMTDLNAK